MSKALKEAIEANDAAAVAKALKTVKDLSRKLPKAEAPLVHAIKCGAEAVMDVLLDAGAMKGKWHEVEHPFNLAAEKGNAAVMEKMAARGLPEKVVEHALFSATLTGKAEAVRVIVERCRPVISERVVDTAAWWKDGVILKMLLAHGVDVNVRNDGEANWEQRGETALHDAAGAGYLEPIRLLVDAGADINARDQYGRTPLMHLAMSMPRVDRDARMVREREAQRIAEGKTMLVMHVSSGRRFGDREMGDPMDSVRLLLERGADVKAKDRLGNDALLHYHWGLWREREEENGALVELLTKAGVAGDAAMVNLWKALRADDLAGVQQALEGGADVNRDSPMPVSATPLLMCRSAGMVELLLAHGAKANKAGQKDTPLIAAARSGEMEIVKLLIAAGADIHAIQPRAPKSEYVANAWSAADMNRKHEVAAYLKKLGAGNPVLPDWEPMEPGVVVWENFSEIIVRAPAGVVAGALGRMIKGTVQENVYGKELTPGKRAYGVLQPKGMAWSNVMQVTPVLTRFAEQDEKFLQGLAKEAKAAVMLIEYSDAAGASSMKRFEPGGAVVEEESGDEEMLEEMAGAMGDETPAWATAKLKKLKKEKKPELDVSKLAEEEKFVIAWGSLMPAGKKTVEVSFTNLPAEAFEGACWVST